MMNNKTANNLIFVFLYKKVSDGLTLRGASQHGS